MPDVVRSVALFGLAGLLEIGGGWLVWQWAREDRAFWFAVVGAGVVALYGFVPPLQPFPDFGRVFAAYGAAFIVLSVVWAALMDGFRPDRWDAIGVAVCLAGAAIMLWGPRATS